MASSFDGSLAGAAATEVHQGLWRLPPKQHILKGKETKFDLHRAAKELTVIISTSVGNFTPSTDTTIAALWSIQDNLALHHCRKVLVFDKVPSQSEIEKLRSDSHVWNTIARGKKWINMWNEKREAYNEYCETFKAMRDQNHPALYKVELLFSPHFGHLFGTVKLALERVSTPYVFVTQHDLQVNQRFVAADVQCTLQALHENIASFVLLNRDVNNAPRTENYLRLLPELSVDSSTSSCPDLTAFAGFSDQSHFARVAWYRREVVEEIGKQLGGNDQTAMEHVLHEPWCQSAHKGTFLYGRLQDGPFITDLIHGQWVTDQAGRHTALPPMPVRSLND